MVASEQPREAHQAWQGLPHRRQAGAAASCPPATSASRARPAGARQRRTSMVAGPPSDCARAKTVARSLSGSPSL